VLESFSGCVPGIRVSCLLHHVINIVRHEPIDGQMAVGCIARVRRGRFAGGSFAIDRTDFEHRAPDFVAGPTHGDGSSVMVGAAGAERARVQRHHGAGDR